MWPFWALWAQSKATSLSVNCLFVVYLVFWFFVPAHLQEYFFKTNCLHCICFCNLYVNLHLSSLDSDESLQKIHNRRTKWRIIDLDKKSQTISVSSFLQKFVGFSEICERAGPTVEDGSEMPGSKRKDHLNLPRV